MKFNIRPAIPDAVLPREHGAWPMLLVPVLVAGGIARGFDIHILLLALSAVLFYAATVPLDMFLRECLAQSPDYTRRRQARFWTAAYLLAGALPGIPVLLKSGFSILLPALSAMLLFLAHFIIARRGTRALLADLTAVPGLTLTGPAAEMLMHGTVEPRGWILWLLHVLFFWGAVIYVWMKISTTSAAQGTGIAERARHGIPSLACQAGIIGVILLLSLFDVTNVSVLLAYVPFALHSITGTLTRRSGTAFRILGFLLVLHSLVYALILILVNSS